MKKRVRLCNKLGLHARAAAKFVNTASSYDCQVTLSHKDKTADGKSIMELMMLAVSCGDEIEIETSGKDEKTAARQLSELVNERFGETE